MGKIFLQTSDRLFFRFEETMAITLDDGKKDRVPVEGEALLAPNLFGPDGIGVRLERLGWTSPGIRDGPRETGEIGGRSAPAKGFIQFESNEVSLDLRLTTLIVYDAIEALKELKRIGPDVYMPEEETFSTRLQGTIRTWPEARAGEPSFQLSGNLNLLRGVEDSCGLGWIRSLRITLDQVPIFRLTANVHGALDHLRSLTLLPVFINDKANDPSPTGTSWSRQLKHAKEVWEKKCCIKIKAPRTKNIINKNLKNSKHPSDFKKKMNYATKTAEVFFVTDPLTGHGGAATLGAGLCTAKIVMTDDNVGNNYLLAHELGHVLDGAHPGSMNPDFWPGDHATVLEYTGSPHIANSPCNTRRNCQRVRSDLLTTHTDTPCNPSPDAQCPP